MSVNYTDDSITSDINSSSSQFHQKSVVMMLKSDSNQKKKKKGKCRAIVNSVDCRMRYSVTIATRKYVLVSASFRYLALPR